MELADKVKSLRIAKGMTQEELAHKLGYSSRVSINKVECGRPVSQKIVVKLAAALETTPQYLMGWDDAPVAQEATTVTSDGNVSELVTRFNRLSSEHKDTVLKLIRVLDGESA